MGLLAITIDYTITRKKPRAPTTWQALRDVAETREQTW
jgi:hypothetical protein